MTMTIARICPTTRFGDKQKGLGTILKERQKLTQGIIANADQGGITPEALSHITGVDQKTTDRFLASQVKERRVVHDDNGFVRNT